MLDLMGKREEEGRDGRLSYSLCGDKHSGRGNWNGRETFEPNKTNTFGSFPLRMTCSLSNKRQGFGSVLLLLLLITVH